MGRQRMKRRQRPSITVICLTGSVRPLVAPLQPVWYGSAMNQPQPQPLTQPQLRAYRYRFYPTPDQAVTLARTFGCARYVYN